MKYSAYIIVTLILALITYCIIKRIKIYDAFAGGAKNALKLVFDIFPFVATILIMNSLLEKSGINKLIIDLLTPVFKIFGIYEELVPLVILKPFSGSGSLALLGNILSTYGVDSTISRAACVVFGSGETVFYISAVYFSRCKNKKCALPIAISLISIFLGTVFGCFIINFI